MGAEAPRKFGISQSVPRLGRNGIMRSGVANKQTEITPESVAGLFARRIQKPVHLDGLENYQLNSFEKKNMTDEYRPLFQAK